MLRTPSGIVIDVSPEQLENALRSMFVTLFPITAFVNPEQPINAYCAILVTPSGIVTEVSPEQFANA